ncbi:MAG: bifunctional UDP-N-acetylglucosamine diphosphorylase/glucosamine-1-phosphate N-acetyltransferase GlmU [Firmicutes bacterium]|nr:bifunctional UDP-N-acetylglucosamine diphosphorylase/glucosamine-1-phosphate N-acetyltransferase GlmU [Bacillota bacterium]
MNNQAAVILAAGEGKRMNSDLPKVLHPVCGQSMLAHVVKAVRGICDDIIVVVGHKDEKVKAAFGETVRYAQQAQQLGTGHAVMQAEPLLPQEGNVFVLCGDTPLLSFEMMESMLATHQSSHASATILTAHVPEPLGYGRIIRDDKGNVSKIVEERDASAKERRVCEINTGSYIFNAKILRNSLAGLHSNNEQGEYYLTDCIEFIIKQNAFVATSILPDYRMALGVNDRIQLAQAQTLMQSRINDALMATGVTMVDPRTTYVDAGVEIGRDTVIFPNTTIKGTTQIGEGCVVGPNSEVIDCYIGRGTVFRHSVATSCTMAEDVTVGPFAHLRPETVLKRGVKIGDFVEIKKSQIGSNSKVAHLSYIGDADIGSDVNMGGGIIVVNYDGRTKHKTVICDQSFVGCNSNLVAPVTIGQGAFVAAGSTITKDVPAGALSLARAQQVNKEGLAARFLGEKKDE